MNLGNVLPVLVAAGCIWATPAAAGPTAVPHRAAAATTRTHVLHVRPVGPRGHLLSGYTVSDRRTHARCWTSSEATGTAYRCMAGNVIADPCWAAAAPKVAYCLLAPWSHRVLRLRVTKGYDSTGYPWTAATDPWGVRLAGGLRCEWLQGASGAVHGRRISYGCPGHRYLVGNPDRSQPVWTIRRARQTSGGQVEVTGRARIAKAWFGKPSRKG